MNNQLFFYPLYPQENDFIDEERGVSNLFTPKETLLYGNALKNEYVPYKNYRPSLVSSNNNLLLNLMEVMDLMHDLRLYLDIYPEDIEMHKQYVMYCEKYHKLMHQSEMNEDNPYPNACSIDKKSNYVFTPSIWIR